MSTDNALFTPIKYGTAPEVGNRTVMAPLTRIRADADLAPTQRHVDYYRDRADNNLIISEATIIAPQSIASNAIPCCFNELQAKAWKKVTDAVHSKGAIMAIQAWHQGRVAHDSYIKHPLAIANDNAVTCESSCTIPVPAPYTAVDCETGKVVGFNAPRLMTVADIKRYYQQLLDSADLAFNVAGFDIMELHGAHGYLLDQFFNKNTNQMDSDEAKARGDGSENYGGSLENRFRIAEEALTLLCAKYPGKIAIRISPHDGTGYHGVTDPDPINLYKYIYERLAAFPLAYVLCTEPRWDFAYKGDPANDTFYNLPMFSSQFSEMIQKNNPHGIKIIGCGGFTPEAATKTMALPVEKRPYDAIGFGRWYIANPDIVQRLKNGAPFNRYNRNTFYMAYPFHAGEESEQRMDRGYNDYPFFAALVEKFFGADAKVEDVLADKAKVEELIEKTKGEDWALVSQDVIGMTKSSASRL